MSKKTMQNAAAVFLALGLWQAASMILGMEMLLASPFSVLKTLFRIGLQRDFLSTVAFSALRITGGFLLALFFGTVLAVLSDRFRVLEVLLRPYVVTIKTVPIASFIILCLIWVSMDGLTVLIAFLIAFPVVYGNVLQGLKHTDPKLLEMAELFHVPYGRKLLYIYLPAIRPHLLTSCSVGMGMAWKAGIAAEVIGVLDGSIGEALYDAKVYFNNAELLAWTVVIILLSVLLEKLFAFLIRAVYREVQAK